jgi:hypothetical protein
LSIRLFGAGVVLDSALTLSGSCTLHQNVTDYAFGALSVTIAAGVYDFFSFAAKVNSLFRQELITKKHASLTAPALASVLFKFVFPTSWSAVPGANKINCTFAPTGFVVTAGALQTTIKTFTLTNGTGTWLSQLGLALESTATATPTYAPASPDATLATFTGLFQPRSLFCFTNSVTDTWDNEVRPSESTLQLRDGTVLRWSQGSVEAYREIVLVDLPANVTGYPLDAVTFSSFGANRSLANLQVPDIAGLTNIASINTNITLVADDAVRIGNDDYWSRVSAVSASLVTLCQYQPTTLVPTAGDVIWKISEAQALWIEAIRTQYLFVYEPDESTVASSKFKATAYSLDLNGRHTMNFSRLDLYLTLFSVVLPLTRRNTPGVVVI